MICKRCNDCIFNIKLFIHVSVWREATIIKVVRECGEGQCEKFMHVSEWVREREQPTVCMGKIARKIKKNAFCVSRVAVVWNEKKRLTQVALWLKLFFYFSPHIAVCDNITSPSDKCLCQCVGSVFQTIANLIYHLTPDTHLELQLYSPLSFLHSKMCNELISLLMRLNLSASLVELLKQQHF
jgi:hypothetical protein